MTDRIPLDHLTSDGLDQLYEQLARAQRVAMHALDQNPPATDPGLRRQHAAAIKALGASETELAELRATVARVHAIADEYPAGIDTALIWEALDEQHPAAAGHIYLSTGCHHGHEPFANGLTGHQYCQNKNGILGAKKPARCKSDTCNAPCICPCHREEPQP
jgi:hypothetical protein